MSGQLKKRRVHKSSSNTKKVVLEKVIGNTISHNSAFSCNPATGEIAYPAGCLVVIYSPKRNKQIRFLSNKENKAISFICFSNNGKYLAVGESGHRPAVVVWDTSTWQTVSELRGHKFGISCGCFSPNLKYLVTVGFQHDGYLYLWDWRAQQTMACNKATTKVHSVAFAEDGTYFVTAGLRHMKFWYLDPSGQFKSTDKARAGVAVGQLQLIESRSGVLGAHRDSTFVDVVCGKGAASGYTYGVTSVGMLCLFSANRLMEKWVNLKSSRVFALTTSNGVVACACADGVVRLFDHITLEYINTLPRPYPIGKENVLGIGAVVPPNAPSPNATYPDALAVRLTSDGQRVAVVYTDRSLMIWDIRNPKKIGLSRSFMAHSACIWDLAVAPDVGPLPDGSFVTCSADNTIRVWNLDAAGPTFGTTASADDLNSSFSRSIYSKELLHTIHVTDDYSAFKISAIDPRSSDSTPAVGEGGIRCCAISPDGKHIAAGDRQGNLRVYDTYDYSCVEFKEAHDAEILTMDFSSLASSLESEEKTPFLLGTGSRDRLVHVFDAAKNYDLISTLDDHSSSITALKFACDGSKLLTCSADKSIIFRTVSHGSTSPPSGHTTIKRYHQTTVTYGTLYDLDVDTTQKYVVAVGQDKRLSIYNISDGKIKRSYKATDPDAGDVLKVALDPAGIYAATSCSNKVIRVYDFFSGECLARLTGHSELITGVKFTRDCRRIVSVAGDGCIFVWKLSIDFTKNMKARLAEQNPGRDLDVVTSTPAHSHSGRLTPLPPDLSPIATPSSYTDETHDESFEGVQDGPAGLGDISPLNNSVLPQLLSDTGLPHWAQVNGKSAVEEAERGTGNPKGRWGERAREVDELVLWDESGGSTGPGIKWPGSHFDRRLTIETDPEKMWAEPNINYVPISKSDPVWVDDGTLFSDVAESDGEPRRTKLASSIEDGDMVLQDDEDLRATETIGALEDDENDSDDDKDKEHENDIVYFDDQQVQVKAVFRVEDEPAGKLQTLPKDDKHLIDVEEIDDTSAKLGRNHDSGGDDDYEFPNDIMLRDNFGNLDEILASNPLRLSISRKFLNKVQTPNATTTEDKESIPTNPKQKEPLAKDIEKTREYLAKLQKIRGEQLSPTSNATSISTQSATKLIIPPQPKTNDPSKLQRPTHITPTCSPTSLGDDTIEHSNKQLSPTNTINAVACIEPVDISTSISRFQSPPRTLSRPLSEYEQSLKTLSSAFNTSLALFEEVQGGLADPTTENLRFEFSSLFSSLQLRLSSISASSTPELIKLKQHADKDLVGEHLEKYSDMLVNRVMEKLGTFNFSSRLFQSSPPSDPFGVTKE